MLFTYAIPILIIVAFLSGLYFCVKYSSPKSLEGLTNMSQPRCPNILVQKGLKYYLHNSKIAKVPGVNPIEFANLEEYVEFLDWQRSQGIRCPVLYLQHTYDAQGDAVYKVRPGVTEMQGGLPPTSTTAKNASNQLPLSSLQNPNPTLLVDATRDDPPYNTNSVPAYDASSYYVGTTTPLDAMNQSQENLLHSPDPMSDNWGGADYTQKLVDTGYYKGNEVNILVQ
jgi:hypothetical protein